MIGLIAGIALAGACDEEALVSTAEALDGSPPELRDDLAAIGISQACQGPAAEAAAGWSQGTEESRRAADEALATAAGCAGEDRAALWGACGLEARGWFTEAEWLDAVGAVWIPIVAGAALSDGGVGPETTRALVRAVAGISSTLVGPSFAPDGRAEPKWSRKARQAGGSCTARIGVRPDGSLRRVVFVDCADALQDAVRDAVQRSELVPASEDGRPAPGRFEATFTVGR